MDANQKNLAAYHEENLLLRTKALEMQQVINDLRARNVELMGRQEQVWEKDATIARQKQMIDTLEQREAQREREVRSAIESSEKQIAEGRVAAENQSAKLRDDLFLKSHECARLAARCEALEAELVKANDEANRIRSDANTYKHEANRTLSKMSDEIWEKDLELSRLRKIETQFESAVSAERGRVSELEARSQSQQSEITKLGDLLNDERSLAEREIKELKVRLEESVDRYTTETRKLTDERDRRVTEVADLSNQLLALKETHAMTLKQLSDQEKLLDRVAQEKKYEIEKAQLSLQHAREMFERQVFEATVKLERELEAVSADKRRLEEKVKDLTEISLSGRQSEIQWREERRAMETEVERLQSMLKTIESERQEEEAASRRIREEWERRVSQLEGDLSKNQSRRSVDQEEIGRLTTSETQLRRELSTLKERLAAQEPQVQRGLDRILSRERQLEAFINRINRDRAELRSVVREVLVEMDGAMSTHPLRDYLNLTEFELSKIETQLKATPEILPERQALEATMRSLVEQRDFLKQTIESSRSSFSAREKALRGVLERGAVNPLPPLPPSDLGPGLAKEQAESPINSELHPESALKSVTWANSEIDLV
jgi:chromosome segregation ATPase